MNPSILIAISSGIILLLGSAHLVYTFYGPKLTPRDPQLIEQMKRVSPLITKETDMWKCWVGFNASHSLCAILFGLVFGYLAIAHQDFLFASYFLLAIGFGLLACLVVLGKLYWFSIPFRGISIAFACYGAALILNFT
ncbi:MAG: LIC_13387 family protein [Arenimonas sp.]